MRVEKLFFELASESRLSILRELQKGNLKMQEVARRLDVTATEAFRQLERLSESLLVQRQPDGNYAIAEYGKLVLELSSTLEFVSVYREYFSTHEIMRIPSQFLSRLNELSGAKLTTDTIENLNRGGHAYAEAEQYGWGIAEGTIPHHMQSVMDERIQRGVNLKFLIPEERFLANMPPSTTPKNVEIKSLPDIPVIVILTEKEAGICFRQTNGKIDYTGFFGTEPKFHGWVKDLFLYYWNIGKSTIT